MGNRYQYAGFWIRTAAAFIDSIVLMLVTSPLLILWYGFDTYWKAVETSDFLGVGELLISWLLPVVLTIVFWLKVQATPGKMLFSLKVLDELTGQPLTIQQSLIRYVGYFVSTFALLLGFIWIGFDAKKQGWHDKMARTVVVKDSGKTVQSMIFEK